LVCVCVVGVYVVCVCVCGRVGGSRNFFKLRNCWFTLKNLLHFSRVLRFVTDYIFIYQ